MIDLGRAIIRWVYPKRCLFCDEVILNTQVFCEDCKSQAEWLTKYLCKKCGKPLELKKSEICFDCSKKSHAYDAGRAMWLYEGAVKDAIKRYKFDGRKSLANSFSDVLLNFYIKHIDWQIDLITAIPLHKTKLKSRGYNQAALISDLLGRKLDIRVVNDLLIRQKTTRPQKELSDGERILNIRDAFCIDERYSVDGLNLLILDDIYTTGSTLDECAKVLKDKGANRVYFLTLAIGKGY